MTRQAGTNDGPGVVFCGRVVMFGVGRLGAALLQGWRDSSFDLSRWIAVDPIASVADVPCRVVPDAAAARALGPFEVAVVAVKPADALGVVRQARPLLSGRATLVSVAAGVPLASLEAAAGLSDVVRAMPNLAAAERASVTFLCAGSGCRPETLGGVAELFAAVGGVHLLMHEDDLHVATAVGGSGPALVYRFLEALRDAARRHGIAAGGAERIVVEMAAGALALARAGGSLANLREGVTSPRGTTAAALEFLGRDGLLDQLLGDAIAAAKARSRELGLPAPPMPERADAAQERGG